MKILDCTLRDGGFHTNWEFDTEFVRDLITVLDGTGVDVIELGYKSPLRGGKYKKCNDKFIEIELGFIPKAKLSFMVDTKDFVVNNKLDYTLIKTNIHKNSIFNMCRVASALDFLDHSKELVGYLHSIGYETTFNLVRASLLDKSTLQKAIKSADDSEADVLYLADSFGSLISNKLSEFLKIYRDNTDKKIGFHAHNNLGLGFSNALLAMESGIDYVDGSITGMGRGSGNMKLEQLLTYLDYDCSEIFGLINRRFDKLKKQHQWGYKFNYMLTGMKEIHPAYYEKLKLKGLSESKIYSVLNGIKIKNTFDKSEIENIKEKTASVVIPARYKSTRFPGKPIIDIKGIPMIIRVAQAAERAVGKENVYIATEDERISNVVDSYDYRIILTSDSCLTGTDRVAEASLELDSDIIVNVQGDEPMVNPDTILRVIEEKKKFPSSIITSISRFNSNKEFKNRNIVKFVFDNEKNLLYASRSGIPGNKNDEFMYGYSHVAVYAFSKKELESFYKWGIENGKTELEWIEDIEILRFLEMNHNVKIIEVSDVGWSVDMPSDVEKVEDVISERL
jgi:3-deoxy-manno-octulosonate cytidylyltransferase (CMP-KDO synthetase)|tara:strand:+ start:894 stop:2585 length:1692 start_codon:yes stop_codon:yes gene_type:complete